MKTHRKVYSTCKGNREDRGDNNDRILDDCWLRNKHNFSWINVCACKQKNIIHRYNQRLCIFPLIHMLWKKPKMINFWYVVVVFFLCVYLFLKSPHEHTLYPQSRSNLNVGCQQSCVKLWLIKVLWPECVVKTMCFHVLLPEFVTALLSSS